MRRSGLGLAMLPSVDGRQWVGLNDVVVSIPTGWEPVDWGCDLKSFDLAIARSRATRVICLQSPEDRASTLVMVDVDSGGRFVGGRRLDLGFTARGLQGVQTGTACRISTCVVTMSASNVLIGVRYRGSGARGLVDGVRDSISLVPDGFVAIPPNPYGTSVERALGALADAGLRAEAPEVDFPHYVTWTDPSAGVLVPRGSPIAVLVGDG